MNGTDDILSQMAKIMNTKKFERQNVVDHAGNNLKTLDDFKGHGAHATGQDTDKVCFEVKNDKLMVWKNDQRGGCPASGTSNGGDGGGGNYHVFSCFLSSS